MVLIVRNGKGSKDRFVMLSQKLLNALREYYKSLPVKPKEYLFPGKTGSKPLAPRGIQYSISRAGETSGIKKRVTAHVIRHSFATHLLESGVDVRRIQFLMGHKSLRTTAIYMNVSAEFVNKTKSPLDTLDMEGGKNE